MENRLTIKNAPGLEAGYEQMSQDHVCEMEALEWAEALIGDISDEPW